MLYDVKMGNSEKFNGAWSSTVNHGANYDSVFYSNEAIKQRIKLGNGVSDAITQVETAEEETLGIILDTYQIHHKVFFSNNMNNLNVIALNYRNKDRNKYNSFVEDEILYITLDNNRYRMMYYETYNNEIIQTYHNRSEYYGCAIVFKRKSNEVTPIISITVKDTESNNYLKFAFFVDTEGVFSISTDIITEKIEDTNEVNTEYSRLASIEQKRSKYFLFFKADFNIKQNHWPSNTFVVKTDMVDKFRERISKINSAQIITCDTDEFNGQITGNVRTVTFVGVSIPKDFFKNNKIFYAFMYDIDKDELKCIRSN